MNGTKVLGIAAVAACLAAAGPAQRAQAVSLINPGAAAAVQEDAKQLTTAVRWHHHWHHHHWRWHRWHHHRHWRRWHHRYW